MSELKPYQMTNEEAAHCLEKRMTRYHPSDAITEATTLAIIALRRAQPANEPMPTIDSVEVVRCRDCVHFGECLVTENDYCSKGERKENT